MTDQFVHVDAVEVWGKDAALTDSSKNSKPVTKLVSPLYSTFEAIIPAHDVAHVQNKAGYTATLVACGWAGAAKKAKRDGPTDGPTDRRTERIVESRARD